MLRKVQRKNRISFERKKDAVSPNRLDISRAEARKTCGYRRNQGLITKKGRAGAREVKITNLDKRDGRAFSLMSSVGFTRIVYDSCQSRLRQAQLAVLG